MCLKHKFLKREPTLTSENNLWQSGKILGLQFKDAFWSYQDCVCVCVKTNRSLWMLADQKVHSRSRRAGHVLSRLYFIGCVSYGMNQVLIWVTCSINKECLMQSFVSCGLGPCKEYSFIIYEYSSTQGICDKFYPSKYFDTSKVKLVHNDFSIISLAWLFSLVIQSIWLSSLDSPPLGYERSRQPPLHHHQDPQPCHRPWVSSLLLYWPILKIQHSWYLAESSNISMLAWWNICQLTLHTTCADNVWLVAYITSKCRQHA